MDTPFDTRLLSRREIARDTLEVRLARPPGFGFKAGQAIDLALPGIEGGHAFSLVNATHEGELAIATRMRPSPYKRALAALPPGSPLRFEGPFGSLTLHRNPARAAVLIAGGIGITPFVSMLREAARAAVPRSILLLYSNRTPADSAYLDELRMLPKSLEGFRLAAVMTEVEGRVIDEALIRSETRGLERPIFYVAGPPPMVEAMRRALEAAGVEDEDVRSEEFFGYERALQDEAHRAEAA